MKNTIFTLLAFAAINAQAVDFKAELPEVEAKAAEAYADQSIKKNLKAANFEAVQPETYAGKLLDAITSTLEKDFLDGLEERFAVRISVR